MKIHEKLQLHAEEMKNKHLDRESKNKIQKQRRDLLKKRMIPFFFYEKVKKLLSFFGLTVGGSVFL